MADDEVTPQAGELVTANYGWTKPNVGNSDDAWGGMINADLDSIDSTVKSVSTVANAAYPASNPSGYQTAAQVTAAVPVASSTTPLMDGTAAIGSGTTWAKADHVHPVDTSRYAASNPSGFQTAAQVTAAVPVASSTTPAMDGTAAVGTGTTWARADHIHPSDTSKYDATNPAGYQTAANVTASLGPYLLKSGGTLTGALTPSSTAGLVGTTTNDSANAGAVGEVISSNVTSPVTLTTATPANVTSISVTAGDWDISGEIWLLAGTGAPTAMHASINTVSAANPAASAIGTSRQSIQTTITASSLNVLSLRSCRASLASPTTYYLVANCNFPSGSTTATGNIIARRAR